MTNTLIIEKAMENGFDNVLLDKNLWIIAPSISKHQDKYNEEVNNLSKKSKIVDIFRIIPQLQNEFLKHEKSSERVKTLTTFNSAIRNGYSSDVYRDFALSCYILSKSILSHFHEVTQESVMTGYAPIVPYDSVIKKADPIYETDSPIIKTKLKRKKDLDMKTLVQENSFDIMRHFDYYISGLESAIGNGNLVPVVTRMGYKHSNIPEKVHDYYTEAVFRFMDATDEDIETAEKIVAGVVSRDEIDYDNLEIPATESNTEISTIYSLLSSYGNVSKAINSSNEENVKFDITHITNYVYTHRFMQFNESANRFFEDSITRTKITNIDIGPNGMKFYQLDSDMLICPFVDLRDYKIKMVILDVSSNAPYISDDFDLIL